MEIPIIEPFRVVPFKSLVRYMVDELELTKHNGDATDAKLGSYRDVVDRIYAAGEIDTTDLDAFDTALRDAGFMDGDDDPAEDRDLDTDLAEDR